MRLLEVENQNDFSVTRDLLDEVPPYAILSHTWEADEEEVTLQDIVTGTGKDKAGYRKTQFCGKQAASDGLRYFWVDSCCIDRSNYTELSEAINSMFRWYKHATKCYVYLADVSANTCSQASQSPEKTWEPEFRNSRWFTRGWTLQELLASSEVEFFSREGTKLGTKKSLERQIHEITGIPIQALAGSPLSDFRIEERLSWAAKRQTKREEDAAYSLLGLFDLHIPLIYGEGKSNAITRLLHEIERRRKGAEELCVAHSSGTGQWQWLTAASTEIRRWFGGVSGWTLSWPPATNASRAATTTETAYQMPQSITQNGSEYRGAVTVSGGTVFQGNYVGLGPGMLGNPR